MRSNLKAPHLSSAPELTFIFEDFGLSYESAGPIRSEKRPSKSCRKSRKLVCMSSTDMGVKNLSRKIIWCGWINPLLFCHSWAQKSFWFLPSWDYSHLAKRGFNWRIFKSVCFLESRILTFCGPEVKNSQAKRVLNWTLFGIRIGAQIRTLGVSWGREQNDNSQASSTKLSWRPVCESGRPKNVFAFTWRFALPQFTHKLLGFKYLHSSTSISVDVVWVDRELLLIAVWEIKQRFQHQHRSRNSFPPTDGTLISVKISKLWYFNTMFLWPIRKLYRADHFNEPEIK